MGTLKAAIDTCICFNEEGRKKQARSNKQGKEATHP